MSHIDISPEVIRASGLASSSRPLALGPVTEASDLSLAVRSGERARAILNAAKVDWSVSRAALHLADGTKVDNHAAIVRDDTRSVLGVVGRRYVPLQNTDGLSAFDRLIDEGMLAGYSNAGLFDGGRWVWIQAEIGAHKVGPDEIKEYLTLTLNHAGKAAVRWNPTTVRVVCKNTMMLSRRGSEGLTLRHTTSGEERYKSAVAALTQARAGIREWREQARTLYARPLSASRVKAFAAELFPSAHSADSDLSPRLEGMRSRVIDLFDDGKGNYAVRGTAWAALNAVTEYVDHHRATRRTGDNSTEDSRLASAWIGTGAALKRRALDLLLENKF